MRRKPDEIDTLLSGGRLGGPGRERILQHVLRSLELPRRRLRWAVLAAGLAVSSVAAAAILVVVRGSGSVPADYLGVKGTGMPVTPSIDLVCGDGAGPCRPGERLFFRASASALQRWIAIYAERADGPVKPTARRIWMLPGVDEVAPEIPASDAPTILRQAVELGTDLGPGRYRVTILVFDHRPSRAEVKDDALQTPRLTRWLVLR